MPNYTITDISNRHIGLTSSSAVYRWRESTGRRSREFWTWALGAESTDANDQMCVSAFNAFKDDIHARLGVPSVKPWTAALDDKWYFNLNYLRTLGLQLGLKGPRVFPLSNDCERYFNENILGLLSALGQSNLRIKSNAQSIIDQFDQGITSSLKRLFLLEGIVVFTK